MILTLMIKVSFMVPKIICLQAQQNSRVSFIWKPNRIFK